MKLLVATLISTGLAFAQAASSGHSVTVSWASGDAANADTFNVYRANGTCPAPTTQGVTPNASAFTKLNGTPISGLGYGDTSVAAGTSYCYLVSAVNSAGVESCSANVTNCPAGNPMANATIPANPVGPNTPTTIVVVVK